MMAVLAFLLQAATPPPPSAYVTVPPPRAVVLEPGQSAIARVEDDGTLTALDRHPGGRRPAAGEMRIDLRVADGRTLLTVTNAGARFLRYRAALLRAGGPSPTSVCPVMPGGRFALERWPYAITAIALDDFRYADDRSLTCR